MIFCRKAVSQKGGRVCISEPWTHIGGTRTFPTPTYVFDIALRTKRS